MNKRIIKKIQKAKTLSVKTTSKHSAEESKRIVSDKNIKKVGDLRIPKKTKVGKKAARKTISKKRTAGTKALRAQTAQAKRVQKRVLAQEKAKKLPPPPVPEGGRAVTPDYHISGDFDGMFENVSGQRGIESALNRLVLEHPEIQGLIQEFMEVKGDSFAARKELGQLFAEAYFDTRKNEAGNTDYMQYEENLWAIYESGYIEFVDSLRQAIEAARKREEIYSTYWR